MRAGRWLSGYVTVRCEAVPGRAPLVVDDLRARQIEMWDIVMVPPQQPQPEQEDMQRFSFNLRMRQFRLIRAVLRAHRCRARIVRRMGGPVVFRAMRKRPFFLVGGVLFCLILYIISSLIWFVQVTGNERLPRELVLEVAKAYGVVPFRWRSAVSEPALLSKQMQQRLPGTAWVGVELRGVKVVIHIVEAKVVPQQPTMRPRHLVAKKTAVIRTIIADRGKPVVSVHKKVKAGDVLISGIIGSDEHAQLVSASGVVTGLVWYEVHSRLPFRQQLAVFSGRQQVKRYLFVGRRALQWSGYRLLPFAKAHVEPTYIPVILFSHRFPFGEYRERIREVQSIDSRLTPTQAKHFAVEQAKLHLIRKLSDRSPSTVIPRITRQKLLLSRQTKTELRLQLFFEVEEDIAVAEPILLPLQKQLPK
jgi:similar to stage IV sporulation protein